MAPPGSDDSIESNVVDVRYIMTRASYVSKTLTARMQTVRQNFANMISEFLEEQQEEGEEDDEQEGQASEDTLQDQREM